jgi:hypothetical protein
VADHVLVNDGDETDLAKRVDELIPLLVA